MTERPTTQHLWDWAVAAYRAPGVAEACLTLQDHHGQNVPLLLWAAWTAAAGRPADDETLEAACDTARSWEETVIAPLRQMRRTLKSPVPDMDDAARLALRDDIKAVELAAERRLLEALEALAPPADGRPRAPLDALAAVSRVWSPVTPRPALRRLAEQLST